MPLKKACAYLYLPELMQHYSSGDEKKPLGMIDWLKKILFIYSISNILIISLIKRNIRLNSIMQLIHKREVSNLTPCQS